MKISSCYKCHQKIWWGETERGAKIAINTWTSAGGKIIPIDPEADVPVVRHLKKTDPEPSEGTKRYVTHFATCKPKR